MQQCVQAWLCNNDRAMSSRGSEGFNHTQKYDPSLAYVVVGLLSRNTVLL